ncbi:MAG: DUF4197 domain-containing protein [Desulfuromonadaceae bacterium]|nr:DUF4197 domain-containing protein [Desulfuromonadaceae bacterium]
MKPILFLVVICFLLMQLPCHAGFFDEISRILQPQTEQKISLDDSTIVKGLKEVLATGTERAVAAVARTDGYFGNQMIKILLPDKVRRAADVIGALGYRQQVDEAVLTMNRAAEKAAPKAAVFFGDAIRQMTVEDAKGILSGGETAATDFFDRKTRSQLFAAFKPTVATNMDKAGATRAYKEMIGKYDISPLAALAGVPSVDLDTYVTNKALDGLFKMVAEEEKKIRTNPAARTTDVLRKVFGST